VSVDIELTEGESFLFQWTYKEDGTVENVTGWTVTIYAHDDGAAVGTNRIDGGSVTLSDAANGVVTYTFTAANTLITESTENITHVEGTYSLKGVNGSQVRWSDYGRFKINRNPFIAAT
jgi:hypothetical protein